MKGAVAIFVKTPGLSPVKSRLAQSIGEAAAFCFYDLSCRAVQAAVCSATEKNKKLTPFWAVAEAEAVNHERWKGFARVVQGEGGLGDRLDAVYRNLLSRHDYVLLIGADCPHLSETRIHEAVAGLQATDFVIGKSGDGGFYLFGGRRPVATSVWRDTPYSSAMTAEVLWRELARFGSGQVLPLLNDIDTAADLQSWYLQHAEKQLPSELAALRDWLQTDTVQSLL